MSAVIVWCVCVLLVLKNKLKKHKIKNLGIGNGGQVLPFAEIHLKKNPTKQKVARAVPLRAARNLDTVYY